MLEYSKTFQNDIIKKKYCLDNENSYEDIINNRFLPYFKECNFDKDKLKAVEEMLLQRRFIFGGSILRGFKSNKKMSLSNCYVLGFDGDSIEDIFTFLKKAARTMSYGGGVGEDISILRAKDTSVGNAAKSSTGAVSFMPLIDLTTKTIGQKNRRGSNLCAIQDWHPDLPLFIRAKAYPEEVFSLDNITQDIYNISAMNISVKLSDEFMIRALTDGDWEFVYPDIEADKDFYNKHWVGDLAKWVSDGGKLKAYGIVKAKDLLMKIAECAWKCGDPGILFWDNHKKHSTVEFNEKTKIENVNPCVTGDTMLFTRQGLEQIQELIDKEIEIWNGFEWVKVIPGITGYNKEILEVTFNNGIKLKCTKNHKFVLKDGITRVDAINLKPDDELLEWKGVNGSVIRGVKVKRIRYAGIADKVYCFTEPKRHLGMFNGIVTGQCGEMPLHRNASCNLGAIVLYKYVENPYSSNAKFNFELFENDCKLAVETMDCILDESIKTHPFKEQREQAAYERRIGIGITGFADCLAMMGLKYNNSSKTIDFIEEVMRTKCKTEWETSLELAISKGCAPALKDPKSRVSFLNQPRIREYLEFLDDSFEHKFMQHGVRNIAISTVQPAGTLSIIADNCTSGIEPLFALSYTRKTRITGETVNIYHQPLLQYAEENNIDLSSMSKDEILETFNYIEAHDVNWYDRLLIQSTAQKYVDTAISSTINLPTNATVDDIYNIYVKAWEFGLKGITVFRDGCKAGVLESSDSSNKKHPVLTKEDYLNITKFCEQNQYNAETALAFIESYLRVGKVFKDYNEFSEWIQNLDVKQDNANKQISNENNLGLYEIELLDEEDAVRHRVKWKNGIKVYINVTMDKDENKPLETFVSLPYEAGLDERGEFSSVLYLERKSDWDAINRLISVLLRYNIPLTEIIEQLQKSSYSMFTLSALMKRVLSKYLVTADDEEISDWDVTIADGLDDETEETEEQIRNIKNGYNICPECKNKALIFEAGCWKCLNCFYSKCE